MSSPACFIAMIAIAVSRMLPQLSDDFRDSSSATQSSKILSGVARIVSATSWVVKLEQSSAFSSRHSNPFSILSGFCWLVACGSSLVACGSVSLSAMVSVTNNNKSRTRNTPSFFMD